MTEDTNNQEAGDQPHADASIDLRMDRGALQINIAGPEDQMANEAVHFAHWIGRNLQALTAMAKQDFQLRQLASAQSEALSEPAANERLVVEAGGARLLGPDGRPVN